MEPTKNSNKTIGISIAVIAIVAVIAVSVLAGKNSATTPATTATDQNAVSDTATTPTNKSATYKDGTYTATGSYMSPGGADKIAVTLTLKNDIVTDASVTPEPGDNVSAKYQNIFATNYKQYVVGQDISTLSLTKVSGSSLTGKGFNDAVAQIEVQAQA